MNTYIPNSNYWIIRNLSANNFQSLFARAGFFAIITLYQKLPLFRPPFSLPFHPSASPKPPQKFHSFTEKAPRERKNNRPFVCKGRLLCLVCLYHFSKTYASSKASLPSPQMGHSKSSETSSQGVPGAIPWLGSPTLGSYSYPQGQTYFFISVNSFQICFKCLFCYLFYPSHAQINQASKGFL